MGEIRTEVRPNRVIITFCLSSPSPMRIRESASGRYELIWLIDSAAEDLGPLPRLLRRLGTVVDIADGGEAAALDTLADLGPGGITTFADELIRITARIADALGLPYYSPDTALRLTDKAAQRDALSAAGIETPRYWIIPAGSTPDEVTAIAQGIDFPAVVKPKSGQGSRNTTLVTRAEDIGEFIAALGAPEPPFDLIVEQFLEGDHHVQPGFADYLSVESVMHDESLMHIATTGRFPPSPPFRESGFFIPSVLDADDRQLVADLATRAILAQQPERGAFHTEIKLTPDGPRVIEVNGRPGGGIPEMYQSVTGIDLFRMTMDIAVGTAPPVDLPPARAVAFLFYMHAPGEHGLITDVRGLDQLAELDAVHDVLLNRPRGSEVDWHDGNHGYVYSCDGVVDDHEELLSLYRAVPDLVSIDVLAG